MDDIWQRHKTFIVQCLVGGFVLLVALLVLSSMYGDEIPANQESARKLKDELERKPGPSRKSIDDQQRKADDAQTETTAMASQVASMQTDSREYARENIRWVLRNIGMEQETEKFFGIYSDLRQAGLSRLREEARAKLLQRAANLGKEVDESLGITAGFEDNEVPQGIHGLAIVTDIVSRALEIDGLEAVTSIAISPRPSQMRQDGARAMVFSIRLAVRGEPEAVSRLLRSFNSTDNAARRITVVDRVEFIERINKEEDTVKASFHLYGIQYRGLESGGTQ